MAKPTVRRNKQGIITYQAAIRIKGFEPHFKSFSSREAAEEYQRNYEARVRKEKRDSLNPRSWLPASGQFADQSLFEVLEKFKASLPASAWHRPTINAVLGLCGDPTIGQLYPSWIKKYILRARKATTLRSKPYAWGSIRHHLSIISAAIKWRAEELDINPPPFVVKEKAFEDAGRFEGLTKEDMSNERNRRFDEGEEAALMLVVENLKESETGRLHWPLLIEFAVHTGARLQELVLAEWKEIDGSMEWWNIPGAHSKTKSRTMMLNDEAMDTLAKLQAMKDPASKRIFHTLTTPSSVSAGFARHARAAKLDNFVFHDLRHEGISRFVLTQPDLPVKAIMTMVGHSSIEMLDRYAKLRPHEMRALMRRRSP